MAHRQETSEVFIAASFKLGPLIGTKGEANFLPDRGAECRPDSSPRPLASSRGLTALVARRSVIPALHQRLAVGPVCGAKGTEFHRLISPESGGAPRFAVFETWDHCATQVLRGLSRARFCYSDCEFLGSFDRIILAALNKPCRHSGPRFRKTGETWGTPALKWKNEWRKYRR